MILGLGTDLVKIARIDAVMARFGERFLNRCFTDAERARGKNNSRFYAKRFAAKEAAAKALGTGFRGGVLLKEIEVLNAESGAPSLILHGTAQARLAALADGRTPSLHLSLSDERDQALAVVVIGTD